MREKDATVTVIIDNQSYRVPRGYTILQAAERFDIYIPTLCSHKDLSPFGGCRLCIVEVEGMRNFPTACTTPVEEGMIIRTHTAQVQSVRKEILQLFLSEHTSSCLICDEREECKRYLGTIRKAGVTTGCRYCPKDGQCELQEVVEKLGIQEIEYPIYYRNLRVEKEDPFYDRDYNLCILCGRCVRMCQEVRLANVLAFKQRGRNTIVGPAYARTHLESGCEFCGACVSVCPTGTLYEKARKWEGVAQLEQVTTCSFCGVGCQISLQIKADRVIGGLPAEDPLVNNGQLCVKGRFCIPELVNGPWRLRHPFKKFNGLEVDISWEDAITLAAEQLSRCAPDEFGLLISSNCTTEDLYIAQKFARVAMGSNQVDSPARLFYGPALNAYLALLEKSVPLAEVREAPAILCVGLDTRYGRSVVGVELRRAMHRGARVITIHPREHNLALTAHAWIQPPPGGEGEILQFFARFTAGEESASPPETNLSSETLRQLARELKQASGVVILVGSEVLHYSASPQILAVLHRLAENLGAGVLPLPAQNNFVGSLLMGTYPELLPGGFSSANEKRLKELEKVWQTEFRPLTNGWNSGNLSAGKPLKVLYLIGEALPSGEPPAEFLIFQNIYPPDSPIRPDLTLPAAAFTEADGTFVNGEGRVQRVHRAVNPPGEALPDWEILCRIARKMGVRGFDFSDVREIHREIAALVDGFQDFDQPPRQARSLTIEGKFQIAASGSFEAKPDGKKYPYLLNAAPLEHVYRGFPLSSRVEGARVIFADEVLHMNPRDARRARLQEGDPVEVTSQYFRKVWPVKFSPELNRGIVQVTVLQNELIGLNPIPVIIRKSHV